MVAAFAIAIAAAQSPAAETISFETQASFDIRPTRIKALVTVTLISPSPIYTTTVTAQSIDATQTLTSYAYWAPGTHRNIPVDLPATHTQPGNYHLILQLVYADAALRKQHAAIALDYQVRASNETNATTPVPSIRLAEQSITWNAVHPAQHDIRLDLTVGPYWQNNKIYTPQDQTLRLQASSNNPAPPHWVFQQLARLSWTENGQHQSRIEPWSIVTDADGNWHATPANLPGGSLPTSEPIAPAAYYAIALLAFTVLLGGLRLVRQDQPALAAHHHRAFGVLSALVLTIWLAYNTHPELWFTATWTTGGDVASHMFYASVFNDWFWSGKISGWLPESFAGFPAFTYYFPFPFALTALLAVPLGLQSAFKVICIAPVVLLPAATYAMTWLMRWPLTARLFAMVGATAFLLTTRTTLWGGNALGTLTGEFAYGWGMMATALFLGVLHRTLTQGGRWWVVAALAEATVALSHGYPLLVVGFASFGALLVSAKSASALRMVLQIHTLAFLLIAAWMLPLLENLPWSLSNDTSLWVDDFGLLWPRELWPITVGLAALAVIARRLPAQLHTFSLVASFVLVALLGFSFADRIGLAAARFFPLLQWALCVMLAGALGFALERWNSRPLLWALTASFATVWWCHPGMKQVGEWAEWNLSGYEAKPMWPVYRDVANHLKGPLSAPRVLFEHAPASVDVGSNRALEALPLFGTRPTLEGLYMESALTGPFIYQAQSEVSARPSSPLSHYRSVPTNVDQALAHMRELYADTLLLRTKSMKEKFRADSRLEVIAEIDPFLILKVKDFSQQLVEPIAVPLSTHNRVDWMEDAFARFRLAHPYQTRRVYLADGQTTPAAITPVNPAQARLVEFDHERLVFETNAIGQPHLIRMTYHPRWRSTTGEPVFLTEPSFMLVVPTQSRVEIVFGDTLANQLGRIGAMLGIAIVLITLIRPRWTSLPAQPPEATARAALNGFIATSLIIVICAIAWWVTPDRAFFAGFDLLAKKDFNGAAAQFEQAEERRHYRAAKAEALYWAAHSHEIGNNTEQGIELYEKFRKTYPETYPYPEASYRLIVLYANSQRRNDAIRVFNELEGNAPGNSWTEKARQILFPD